MQRQRKFNNRNQKPKKKVSKINPKLLVKKATETESDTFTSSKVFNYLLNSFLAGFYAQLLIVPLLVFYLKVYSLYSLFLGFSLAPVFVVLLCVIPILLLSQLAQVSVLVEFLVALIHKLCLLTMTLPFSVVHFQNFTWKHLACTYLIICSLAIFLKYRRLKYLKWTSVGLGMILLQ